MKPIRSMVVGTIIIAVAMLINVAADLHGGRRRRRSRPTGCRSASVFIILTVALIALGELFTSPRMYEYIGALAPKGQEGLFLGYANLPLALGAMPERPGRRLHLQRDHGQRRDHEARRPARTGAGQQHAGLGDPDGDRLRVGRVAVAVQRVAERQQTVARRYSRSASQRATSASDGMRQSPRGERATDPTFGPSGITDRFH